MVTREWLKAYAVKAGNQSPAYFEQETLFTGGADPMSCVEMKELELLCRKFAERRNHSDKPVSERRNPLGFVRRAGQAQVAYLMRAHRDRCSVCRYEMVACG
jgi:hypothetical protein